MQINLFLLALLTLWSSPVHAYVGPGMGAGTLAVVLGIVASILLAVFALLWYPLKRFFKKLKKKDLPGDEDQ